MGDVYEELNKKLKALIKAQEAEIEAQEAERKAEATAKAAEAAERKAQEAKEAERLIERVREATTKEAQIQAVRFEAAKAEAERKAAEAQKAEREAEIVAARNAEAEIAPIIASINYFFEHEQNKLPPILEPFLIPLEAIKGFLELLSRTPESDIKLSDRVSIYKDADRLLKAAKAIIEDKPEQNAAADGVPELDNILGITEEISRSLDNIKISAHDFYVIPQKERRENAAKFQEANAALAAKKREIQDVMVCLNKEMEAESGKSSGDNPRATPEILRLIDLLYRLKADIKSIYHTVIMTEAQFDICIKMQGLIVITKEEARAAAARREAEVTATAAAEDARIAEKEVREAEKKEQLAEIASIIAFTNYFFEYEQNNLPEETLTALKAINAVFEYINNKPDSDISLPDRLNVYKEIRQSLNAVIETIDEPEAAAAADAPKAEVGIPHYTTPGNATDTGETVINLGAAAAPGTLNVAGEPFASSS